MTVLPARARRVSTTTGLQIDTGGSQVTMEVVGMKAGTGVVQIKDCCAGVWRTGKKMVTWALLVWPYSRPLDKLRWGARPKANIHSKVGVYFSAAEVVTVRCLFWWGDRCNTFFSYQRAEPRKRKKLPALALKGKTLMRKHQKLPKRNWSLSARKCLRDLREWETALEIRPKQA